MNGYNCPDCIYKNFVFDVDGTTFRGNRCLFGQKKCNKKLLNDYPCDVFLHNALRFIAENKPNVSYDEICNAIIRSGGELSELEKEYNQLK